MDLSRFAEEMTTAWRQAALDLGFEFVAPYRFAGTDGTQHDCLGYVPNFGGPMGFLICGPLDSDAAYDAGERLGYYMSGLSPSHYNRYVRAKWIELLNDLGWFGPTGCQPAWFGGAMGRHGGKSNAHRGLRQYPQ